MGAVTDITNHRRAEESLRKSEAYLADAQKLSQTGSWAWSPEVGIKYWSEECYRVQGFDPRDGLPRFEELFQRIHPDDQPKLKELMERMVREKIEFETDYRLVCLTPTGDSLALLRWSFDLVMELSELKLETLRQDGDFILYRGRHRRQTDATPPPILVLTPAMEHPAPGCLRRMERIAAILTLTGAQFLLGPLALTDVDTCAVHTILTDTIQRERTATRPLGSTERPHGME